MRVLLVSANLGGIDRPVVHMDQVLPPGVTLEERLVTDETMPPRGCAMTPRLQAKIPKCFAWQLWPGYDVYLWLDYALEMQRDDTVAWLLRHLEDHDLAVFRHPTRLTVATEAAFIRDRLLSSRRLQQRYTGEWADELLATYGADPAYRDTALYACGCVLYVPSPLMERVLWDWWAHQCRYHLNDQLSLPYLVQRHQVNVKTIDADIFHSPHLRFTRGR